MRYKHLGYDPFPALTHWRGTPIPPVHAPVPRTDERWRIANYVWWNGPPWTVLRNAHAYLWHVMDYGTDEDITFTLKDIDRSIWIEALDAARPGVLSKGSYVLGLLLFEHGNVEVAQTTWTDDAHQRDFRPLRNLSCAQRHERYQRAKSDLPVPDRRHPT